jgi:hypothetical protein
MRLSPAQQEEFEVLLWKGHTSLLTAPEEERLRELVGIRNPAMQGLHYSLPELVNAGLVAHGVDVLLKALAEE